MQKKKKGKDTTRRLGNIPFLFIWIIGHVLSWVITYAVANKWFSVSDFVGYTAVGLVLGGGIALMQKMLLRYTFRLSLDWWLRISLIGWVLGWLAFFRLEDTVRGFYNYPVWALILPVFMVPAVAAMVDFAAQALAGMAVDCCQCCQCVDLRRNVGRFILRRL